MLLTNHIAWSVWVMHIFTVGFFKGKSKGQILRIPLWIVFPCPKFPSSQIQPTMTPAQDMLLILLRPTRLFYSPFPPPAPLSPPTTKVSLPEMEATASTSAFTLAPDPSWRLQRPPTKNCGWPLILRSEVPGGQWKYILVLLHQLYPGKFLINKFSVI